MDACSRVSMSLLATTGRPCVKRLRIPAYSTDESHASVVSHRHYHFLLKSTVLTMVGPVCSLCNGLKEGQEDIVIGEFANRMRIVFLIHSDFFALHYVSLFVLRSRAWPTV